MATLYEIIKSIRMQNLPWEDDDEETKAGAVQTIGSKGILRDATGPYVIEAIQQPFMNENGELQYRTVSQKRYLTSAEVAAYGQGAAGPTTVAPNRYVLNPATGEYEWWGTPATGGAGAAPISGNLIPTGIDGLYINPNTGGTIDVRDPDIKLQPLPGYEGVLVNPKTGATVDLRGMQAELLRTGLEGVFINPNTGQVVQDPAIERRYQIEKEEREAKRRAEEVAGGRAFTRGEREAGQAFAGEQAEKQRASQERASVASNLVQYLSSGRTLAGGDTAARIMLDMLGGAGVIKREGQWANMPQGWSPDVPGAWTGAGLPPEMAGLPPQGATQPTNLITPQPSAVPQAGAPQMAPSPWNPEIVQTPEEQLPVISAQRGFNGVVNEPTAFLAGEEGPERVAVQPARPGWFNPVGAQRGVGTAPYPTNLVRGMGAERTRELGMGQPEPRLQPMGAQRTRELGLGQYGQLPQAQRDIYGGSRAYQPRTASEFLARRAGMSNLVRRPLTPEQQATYGGSQTYGGPKFVINVA